jgi:hypothetical protein
MQSWILRTFLFGSAGLFGIFFSNTSIAQDTSFVDVGGALRYNVFYKNWVGQEDNQKKGGELAFDTFYLDADAEKKGITVSAQYRFYQGYHFLRYGYLGGDLSDNMNLKLGVVQVPFGLLSFASNSWFFSTPYYLGLEDDYDAGLKWKYTPGKWTFHAAYFKNSEGSFTGSSPHSARFSYDVVGNSEEVHQGNLRVTYSITENWEVGASGQMGGLYNRVSQKFGEHSAYAAHMKGNIGSFGVKTEFIGFNFSPKAPYDHQAGTVKMGAYDFPYQVARRGRIYLMGLNYDFDVDWGPIEGITIYEDFSYFEKDVQGFADSKMNIVGFRVDAGNFMGFFDVASGQSHPWLGPAWTQAFARGSDGQAPISPGEVKNEPKVDWTTRFNANLGYYF